VDADLLLFKAARKGNVGVMLEALALGADKAWVNYSEGASTALHEAVLAGSVTAAEFLILNGAKVDSQDALKRTPLWLATHTGDISS
jgi:ankyrin repeat protein